MRFDYEAAIKDGIPPVAIAQHLAQQSGFDLNGALVDGVPLDAVIQHLASARPSLTEILHNQTDETKMLRAGMDAGYKYEDVDRAISAELERQRLASEKRTPTNIAGDLIGQVVNRGKPLGGLVQSIGDAIAPEPDKPIDTFREEGGFKNVRQIIGKGLSQYGSEIYDEGKAVEQQLNVEMPNSTTEGLYSGLKSTARQAPMMLSPFGTLATVGEMSTEVGLEKYGEARQAGYAPGTSALIGAGHGGVEAATEILPTKIFKEAVAGKIGLKEFIMGQLKNEIPGEQLATLAQDAIDQAAGLSGKTKGDWEQYWRERPDAAYQTLLATLAQGGVSTGGVQVANMLRNTTGAQLRQLDQDINNAEWNPQQIDAAAVSALSPDNAQLERRGAPSAFDDATQILDAIGQASDVGAAIDTALNIAQAPIANPIDNIPPPAVALVPAGSAIDQAALQETPQDSAPVPIVVPAPAMPSEPPAQSYGLQEFAAETQPMRLEEVQALVDQARASGYAGHTIIEHPAGGGYLAVPRAWVPQQPAEAPTAAPAQPAASVPETVPVRSEQPAPDLVPVPRVEAPAAVMPQPEAPKHEELTTERLSSGELLVTGTNAAQRIKEAAPQAATLTRRDGAVLVAKRDAEAVQQALKGAPAIPETAPPVSAKIEDFGEKIGGARKDTSLPTGPRPKALQPAEQTPAWQRRFTPVQNVLSAEPSWQLFDTKTGKAIRGAEFKSEQAAREAIPLVAVAQKHRVVPVEGGVEILRDVTDRKRIKVVDQVFPTREAATAYMAQNAQAIIETKTAFREELFARPEKVMRDGKAWRNAPATSENFAQDFGFRGVEFGNWNNQGERQEVMNHAYDGLRDLAEVLGVPAKALSLNGDLALAFGARGQGLSGAVAHYERNYGVINLTKMQGAGALGHEWFHALDHYFGRQDGKAKSDKVENQRGDRVYPTAGPEDYASHGLRFSQSGMREELRQAYKALIDTLFTKAERFVEDTAQAERFVGSSRDALAKRLAGIRQELEKAPDWMKRHNKPATAEQLAEFDRLADDLIEGKAFALELRAGDQRRSAIRLSNDQLDALSRLYKTVRGRSGMNAEHSGLVDGIRSELRRYAERVKMLEEARTGAEKIKRVPTRYAMDAKRIDQGSATDYWTTPHEMVARAFSAYVEDKLQGRSDFLSFGSDNSRPEYRLFSVRPFPEGEERLAINRAFDDFIGALQIRETETGLAFYDQGGPLLAPNGKPSKLTPAQYRQVRTPEFKAWFGDWEKEPANASRIVDENGEPRVVYHGSRAAGTFRIFESNERGLIWAGSERDTAESYAGAAGDVSVTAPKRGIVPVFLNIRQPMIEDAEGARYYERPDVEGEAWTDWIGMEAKRQGYDGAIIRNVIDDGGELDGELATPGDDFVVFRPEQLKSAIENTGAFGPNEPDYLNDLASDQREAAMQAIDRAIALKQGRAVPPLRRESALIKIRSLRKRLEAGTITTDQFIQGVEALHARLEQSAAARQYQPAPGRARGADYIRQRLLAAKRAGEISAEAVDLAEWFIAQNPALLDELGVSINTAGQHEAGARGRYLPAERIVQLFKGNVATTTAVHEVLHHLERMMPAEMQVAIRDEYQRRLAAEIERGEHPAYFAAVTDFAATGKREYADAAAELIQRGEVPADYYQFFNPSEFWAVNMQELVKDRFAARDSVWGRIRQWLGEAVEHIKGVLGLTSDAPLLRALNRLLKTGDGQLGNREMLAKADGYRDLVPTEKAEAVRDWVKDHVANHRGWMLGALTRDQLADIYGAENPEVAEFDRVTQAMDQVRNTVAEEADAIIERWRHLPEKEADRLADVMHQATLAQSDPAIDEASPLRADWDQLTPEAQALYQDVRDKYRATLMKLRNGLARRAEYAGKEGQRIAAAIRLEFDKYLEEGPYFPLARFGDFILIGGKGGERTVEAFENAAARTKRERRLRAQGWTVKLTAKKDYSAVTDGPSGEFVGKVLRMVDGMDMDAREKSAIMDGLNQLAIASLPDQSARKHFAHRKGTPGFSSDAMRAFASSMQHVAHHTARVLYGDDLQFLLNGLNQRIGESQGDMTEQQQVANELAKRLELMLNPNTHPVTAALGQVGFVMSLGGSIASGVTNLSQTALVTYPWLGAKFGFTKAGAALTKATSDYFGGPWEKWSGFVLKDNPTLTGDERRALVDLEEGGLISLTQAQDLAGTANTDRAASKRAFAMNRAMKIVGWTFHVPEVFNRQVSALAAYRLARDIGEDHGRAVERARETLRRTHFDYSASNRARWMAGNFTRVVTMFKQYSQNMTYLLWRNAYLALQGETPEVKAEARRLLLGVGAMHFAAAGTLGLRLGVFGVSQLLAVLAMGMGDDDQPWDWETEYRKWLADTFGKKAGEAVAHGLLRLLLNIDLASRVGLNDLWVRAPKKEAEGRDLVEAWMLTLLGPVAGYVGNIGTAAKAFDEGKYGRGLEAMLPRMLASPLKAFRYESEGVRSWRGDDLGVKLDQGDIFATAIGFQPAHLAEMYEGRAAVKGLEHKLKARREELTNMWIAGRLAGDEAGVRDAWAQIQRFNQANPSMRINGDSLSRSLAAKRRNARQIEDGYYLPRKQRALREEGRFADLED